MALVVLAVDVVDQTRRPVERPPWAEGATTCRGSPPCVARVGNLRQYGVGLILEQGHERRADRHLALIVILASRIAVSASLQPPEDLAQYPHTQTYQNGPVILQRVKGCSWSRTS